MHTDNKTKLTWVGVLRLVVGGIFRLISIVALLAVLGISYLLFQNAKQTKETQNLNVQLVEMRQEAETEEDNTDWSKGMLDINSDYKGWLTIYGTQISEPVVQGETNETYLRTNINGEHAEAGTLFLDETTDLTQDGNLIIYGHKMNDGTMFGTLDKFEDEEFFDNNGTVCWESEKGKEYYQILRSWFYPDTVQPLILSTFKPGTTFWTKSRLPTCSTRLQTVRLSLEGNPLTSKRTSTSSW